MSEIKIPEIRIVTQVDQAFLNNCQATFTASPESGFKFWAEDKNGDVDLSRIGKRKIAELDAKGEIKRDGNGDPVLLYSGAEVYVINYDKPFQYYQAAAPEKQAATVQVIEVGKWIGVLTNPVQHANILLQKQIIYDE